MFNRNIQVGEVNIMLRGDVIAAVSQRMITACEKTEPKPTAQEIYAALFVATLGFLETTKLPPEELMAISALIDKTAVRSG
jgi:hypothetical protein